MIQVSGTRSLKVCSITHCKGIYTDNPFDLQESTSTLPIQYLKIELTDRPM